MKRTCLYCKIEFEAPRKDKHYCDASCRQQAYMLRKGTEMVGAETRLSQNFNPSHDVSQNVIQKNDASYDVLHDASKTGSNEGEMPANSLPVVMKQDKIYKPINGKFIYEVIDRMERRNYEPILKVCLNSSAVLKSVEWINVRLRCLIESLLNLSERQSILMQDLIELTNAFTLILLSTHYKTLPENYPYTQRMKELRNKLKSICLHNEDMHDLKLKLGSDLKMELIIMRCELRTVALKKPFRELQFKEYTKEPCKTNRHPEDKPQLKLWQIRYREEKEKMNQNQ